MDRAKGCHVPNFAEKKATKPQNLRKFSSLKVSRYTVPLSFNENSIIVY